VISSRERPAGQRLRVAVLSADALAFLALSFLSVRANLLMRDGVISSGSGALQLVTYAACLAALALGLPGVLGSPRRPAGVVLELAGLAAFVWFPGWLSDTPPRKAETYLWLAQEWAKIPDNLVLLAQLFPWTVAAALLVLLLATYLAARPTRIPFGAVAALAIAALVLWGIFGLGAGLRSIVYIFVYALPWLLAALGFALRRTRLATRASAIGTATAMLFVPYVGAIPFGHSGFERVPGVRRIPVHPRLPGQAPVPLAFVRAFTLDPERRELYSSYGPTSGVMKLDVVSGALDTIPSENSLVRNLWTEPGLDHLLALDWIYGDLLEIGKEPFAVRKRFDLTGGNRVVPMSLVVGRERLETVFTEFPGVVELDRVDLKPESPAHDAVNGEAAAPAPRVTVEPADLNGSRTQAEVVDAGRSLWLRDLGLTRFRSGAWYAVGDVDAGFLVMEIGAVDSAKRFRLVRVDLNRFAVDRTTELPDGGLAMLRVPEHGSVFTAGFFSDRLTEIDERTLDIRRTLRGPRNCRELVYDPKRDLLLATSFLAGELWTIRYSDGQVLRVDRVGNKSMSLALDSRRDLLYLGSRDGIFEIDLATYLNHRP